MKDILNRRIKHRESFRPFAPSIAEEATGEFFEKNAPFAVHDVRLPGARGKAHP